MKSMKKVKYRIPKMLAAISAVLLLAFAPQIVLMLAWIVSIYVFMRYAFARS